MFHFATWLFERSDVAAEVVENSANREGSLVLSAIMELTSLRRAACVIYTSLMKFVRPARFHLITRGRSGAPTLSDTNFQTSDRSEDLLYMALLRDNCVIISMLSRKLPARRRQICIMR